MGGGSGARKILGGLFNGDQFPVKSALAQKSGMPYESRVGL